MVANCSSSSSPGDASSHVENASDFEFTLGLRQASRTWIDKAQKPLRRVIPNDPPQALRAAS
jgi:hypothetical protein